MFDDVPQYDGCVYLMTNAAIPNTIKVGFSVDPSRRAKELGTGALLPFVVYRAWGTNDMRAAEAHCHEALKGLRVRPCREFFRVQTGVHYAEEVDELTGAIYLERFCPVEEIADGLSDWVPRQGVVFDELHFEQ